MLRKIINSTLFLPLGFLVTFQQSLLSDNKNFISLLAKKIKTTDFSYLSNVSKENIEEEKIKIYKEIINS